MRGACIDGDKKSKVERNESMTYRMCVFCFSSIFFRDVFGFVVYYYSLNLEWVTNTIRCNLSPDLASEDNSDL